MTRIAMDERAPAEMQAMLKLLGEVAPGMGVALADNHKSYRLYPDELTDLCVAHGATVEDGDRIYRTQKGYVTTWYVCCADEFPNVFTFSHPAEAAFIGWYTTAAGFDGFLRWAYNSWVKEPCSIHGSAHGLPAILILFIPMGAVPSGSKGWSKGFRMRKRSGFYVRPFRSRTPLKLR